MTQHVVNFNAETNTNSNGTKYALICSSAIFSNTLSLSSSLNVNDELSQPNKTKGKFIFLYAGNFYIFGKERWKTKDFARNDSKCSPTAIIS